MKRAAQDMDTRDPKRHKAEHQEEEGEGDKLVELDKRYSQLVMQAALVFQYTVFSRRIGLQNAEAPIRMTRRLEQCWRSYEGLRRQIQWDPAMGEKPKCLQAIPPIPLPKSVTLASLIPAPAPILKKSSSPELPQETKTEVVQEVQVKAEPAGGELHAPLPLPAHLISDSPAGPTSTASPVPLGAASTNAFQGQALREAAPITEPQAQAEAGAGAGSLDYGSMGFNELSSLINGDPSAFGIHLDGVGGVGQPDTRQSQQPPVKHDVIDLTSDDDIIPIQAPAPKLSRATSHNQPRASPKVSNETYQQQQQAASNDILASLGLSGQDAPEASSGNATGENVMSFDLGGSGEDFSALAGLFQGRDAGPGGSGGQDAQPQPAPTIPARTTAPPSQIPTQTHPIPHQDPPPPSTALAEKEGQAEAGGVGGSLEDLFAEADGLISTIPVEEDVLKAEEQPSQSLYQAPVPAQTQPQAQVPSQPSQAQSQAQSQNQSQQNASSTNPPNQISHDPLLGMSLDISNMGMGNMDMSSLGGNFGIGQSTGMDGDNLNDMSMDTGIGMDMGIGMGGDSGYGGMGGIDMNDFNFGGGDGGDGGNIDGEEFERLMAEFQ
ncbi:hypothetical protein L202_01071 [Cryptococcus amylolentus CBS 6039]|uniref:Uncharacterized protein n=1 Tax=Cryptococcus amylolentus CBS 6039 TaxID=1295533 RepID=A0A1E3I2Q6_9TREE|nr:hypothetical protein L202_01071 [Cryptococcus amylolentus CBS 6039]ODN82798.1 hypothetical protein L202_01071 [Cryptococcus amylolentus CBS 6039]